MPGLSPPSCPGIPDQPHCAGRDVKGGADTQSFEVLQLQVTARLGYSKIWVLAIHGHKVFKQGHIRYRIPWIRQCTSPSQKARNIKYPARQQGCSWIHFSCPTGYTLENKLLPYLNLSTRFLIVIDIFYKGALLYILLPSHTCQIPKIRYPNTRIDWLTSMLTCH